MNTGSQASFCFYFLLGSSWYLPVRIFFPITQKCVENSGQLFCCTLTNNIFPLYLWGSQCLTQGPQPLTSTHMGFPHSLSSKIITLGKKSMGYFTPFSTANQVSSVAPASLLFVASPDCGGTSFWISELRWTGGEQCWARRLQMCFFLLESLGIFL